MSAVVHHGDGTMDLLVAVLAGGGGDELKTNVTVVLANAVGCGYGSGSVLNAGGQNALFNSDGVSALVELIAGSGGEPLKTIAAVTLHRIAKYPYPGTAVWRECGAVSRNV